MGENHENHWSINGTKDQPSRAPSKTHPFRRRSCLVVACQASQGVNWLWQFLGNTQRLKNRRYFTQMRDASSIYGYLFLGKCWYTQHGTAPINGTLFGITRPHKLVPGLATCPFHPHPGELSMGPVWCQSRASSGLHDCTMYYKPSYGVFLSHGGTPSYHPVMDDHFSIGPMVTWGSFSRPQGLWPRTFSFLSAKRTSMFTELPALRMQPLLGKSHVREKQHGHGSIMDQQWINTYEYQLYYI
jgi:hypothetical protein